MAAVMVFVDDAVLGHLPSVCAKDGVSTDDRLTLTQNVGTRTGVASRDWCKNRLTRFLSIILRGGCNSLVDHLLIVLSVIGRDQLVPQVL